MADQSANDTGTTWREADGQQAAAGFNRAADSSASDSGSAPFFPHEHESTGAKGKGKDEWRRWVRPAIGLAFFGLSLLTLFEALHHFEPAAIVAPLRNLPPERLLLAALLTLFSHAALIACEQLGFRMAGRRVAWQHAAYTCFIATALGNVSMNGALAAAAARYWLYPSFGVAAKDITRIVIFGNAAFWTGYVLLIALLLLVDPAPQRWLPGIARGHGELIGALLLAAFFGAVVLSARRRTLHVLRKALPLPPPTGMLGGTAASAADLLAMSGVLWVLLPADTALPYPHFLQAFLIALIAGAASQVPAGLGVFETAFLLLLPPEARTAGLLAALVAFRGIYFLAPLTLGAALLASREIRARHACLRHASRSAAHWATRLIPGALATAIFAAGAVLLFSGALPPSSGRIASLAHLEPLHVIEASHFLASMVGVVLVLLARGIQQRIDAAYAVTVALLVAGMALSLAKGFDYEEAAVLGVMLAAFVPCRSYFHRKGSLLALPASPGWISSVIIVLLGSIWLYAFSFKHVEYSHQLWWRFALDADAPRALRATVGAIALAVMFGLVRLLSPARPAFFRPSDIELAQAGKIASEASWTYANLVLRRDKAVLLSPSGKSFLMYQRSGNSWVAMGDPVGPREEAPALLLRFRDMCDRYNGWPVFFEVRPENVDLYLDLGLALHKLGEEARVDLRGFDTDLPRHARLRQARSKHTRLGSAFEIVPRHAVDAILPELARVSESWLSKKSTREKGFSNADFDVAYLRQFPVAVVRPAGSIIAFANLWLGGDREELSVDLMRHAMDAPHGTMDYLFVELLGWGRAEQYRWFNFGMAPLSGLHGHAGGPVWYRFGGLIYQYGGHFYNFQGLRAYKEKFSPVWSPRYLASPGGIVLPAVLVDVTALIGGGYTGILAK